MATTTKRGAREAQDLGNPALYINRELSWLEFNARVLALAADPAAPLLERCKFLAIFSSNLDEFFMVRVAGQQDAFEAARPSSTPDQLPREEVLEGIAARAAELVAEQSRIWADEVRPALATAGVPVLSPADLSGKSARALVTRFERELYPILTPLAVGPGQPFPYISGLSLNLGVTVHDPVGEETRFARVKLFPGLPRYIRVEDGFVPTEDVVEAHLERIFPGMEILDVGLFRVTRDADFSISDEADDLLGAVEQQLRRRRFGDVVRLEIDERAPKRMVADLREALGLRERDVYRTPRPLDLTSLWELHDLDGPGLHEKAWEPRTPPRLRSPDDEPVDMFAAIRRGDLLVHHPYDDFETSVARLVEQAADDRDVVAIKQTLYRTSGDTPIVPALMLAAEQGIQTVCLVELQARFDEERNIRWARALERAGVHVVYGHVGLKTHAKLCLVVRREGKRLRRYVHVGTGNYHPTTARLYTDLGLFTCREDITEDVADLFNYLTGFSRPPSYRRVLVAPDHLRSGLLAEIERVTEAHADHSPGRIRMKLNALIDGPIIEALYRASQAGVQVDLVVRGICGLRPGIEGVSERIRVISIVGRFLEHARIFAFTSGEETRHLIGSADLMARNLDHRVELVAPVDDGVACRELATILDIMLADTSLAWELDSSGAWSRVDPQNGTPPRNSQDELMERAARRR
ncbi:MAG TPA: polyphosphate kinase 1 [Miltoncostaeaceae bacterium]|nr:polyphosphate kinase 1 [Miltoncostaeaceae bacterium]